MFVVNSFNIIISYRSCCYSARQIRGDMYIGQFVYKVDETDYYLAFERLIETGTRFHPDEFIRYQTTDLM